MAGPTIDPMSGHLSRQNTDPNDTGSGFHIPQYSFEELRYFEGPSWNPRSPYWDISDTTSVDDLEYDELPRPRWIRILKVEPGPINSPLKCSLIPINLDDKHIPYEALSYTWGQYYDNPAPTSSEWDFKEGPSPKLVCNGVWKSITRSLFHALLLFRRFDRARYIWADGLCINQDSSHERNHQVGLMALIYKRAFHVLIWVGGRDPVTVEAAMNLTCYLANQECGIEETYGAPACWYDDESPMQKPRTGARPASASSWYEEDEPPEEHKVVLQPAALKPLVPLFEARYFSRVWVFQEIALSPGATMFWGRARIRFEWVALLADLIERCFMAEFAAYDDAVPGLLNCAKMYNTWRGGYENHGFLDLLVTTAEFRATDERDKVYGLLGVRTRDADPEEGGLFLQVDYTLSRYGVFKRVAQKALIEKGDVRCLAAVEHGHEYRDGEASWVADFANLGAVFLPWLGTNAHSGEQACVLASDGCSRPDCLSVKGIHIDTIATVMDADIPPHSHWRSFHVLEHLQQLIKRLRPHYDDATIALCLTAGFTFDLQSSVSDPSAHAAAMNAFSVWNAEVLASDEGIVSPPSDSAPAHIQAAYRFFQAGAKAVYGYRLFRTVAGRLGIGPAAMRVRDLVVVLFGCNVPLALREELDEHYRLVGQGYVHGLMEGQGVEMWRETGRPPTMFHIF